jgi:hypothetical protein
MPAPILCRSCLGLSLCLALLQGCAAALDSNSTDVPNANAGVRSGFHFSLGLGGGKADLTCDGCVFDSRTGYSGFLAVAHPVAEKTLLGIEATGWTKERSGSTVQIWSLMAHLTQYLNPSSGLFLSGGLGWTGFRIWPSRALREWVGILRPTGVRDWNGQCGDRTVCGIPGKPWGSRSEHRRYFS